MKIRVILALMLPLLTGVWTAVPGEEAMSAKKDTVILMHGMGRTHRSMRRMEAALTGKGYDVVNMAYPSTDEEIDELVKKLDKTVTERCKDAGRIHFVAHSLGGILIRKYLEAHEEVPVGRVVMLAPPNQGSEVADTLKDVWLYKVSTGHAGQVLGTSDDALPQQLGPVTFELGVIAGNVSLNPIYSSFIDGPNDGKVSVERAKVEGMQDFLEVPYSHTWIMMRKEVIDQVAHFLEHGKFKDGESPGAAETTVAAGADRGRRRPASTRPATDPP